MNTVLSSDDRLGSLPFELVLWVVRHLADPVDIIRIQRVCMP